MEYYKRNATGQAVESLQERITDYGVQIVGIDYFNEIFNGVPKGTIVPIQDLAQWKNAKEGRYSIKLPSIKSVQSTIFKNGAPKNKDGLNINKKVLTIYKKDLDLEVNSYIGKILGP